MMDGSKALRAAVNDVLGTGAPVRRSQIHTERNVLDDLAGRAGLPVQDQRVQVDGRA